MADLSNSGKKHALKNGTFASAVRLGNPVRCWGSDARPWKSCPFRKRKTRLRKGGVATDYISKDYVTIFNFNFHFFLFSFFFFFFVFFFFFSGSPPGKIPDLLETPPRQRETHIVAVRLRNPAETLQDNLSSGGGAEPPVWVGCVGCACVFVYDNGLYTYGIVPSDVVAHRLPSTSRQTRPPVC